MKGVSKQSEVLAYWLLAAYLLCLGMFMSTRISNIAGGADPTSYMELSRMFGQGSFSTEMRQVGTLPMDTFDKGVYESIGLQGYPDSFEQRPTAFTGYPLFMAALDVFLPEESAVWWSVFLCDMAAVLCIFLLLKSMDIGGYWALAAAASYGLSPLLVKIGSLPMTDIITGIMASWCWFCARRAHLGKRYAIMLGLGLGYAVLVRLTNVFFFVPVVVTLLFNIRSQRWWWLILLSGLPVGLFWAIFNYRVYGSPISNGYGEVENLFGAEHFVPSMLYYGKTLLMLLFPSVLILFPFSLCFWKTHRRDVSVAWIWVIMIFGFHAFYYASYENYWILRYTLAAWPALLYGSSLVLSHVVNRIDFGRVGRWGGRGIALFVFVASIGYGAYQTKENKAYEMLFHERPILSGVEWVKENTSENDVLLCFWSSGSLYYYTGRSIVRYERLSEDGWQLIQTNAETEGYSVYAFLHLFEYDTAEKLGTAFPGEWEKVKDAWPYGVFRLVKP